MAWMCRRAMKCSHGTAVMRAIRGGHCATGGCPNSIYNCSCASTNNK